MNEPKTALEAIEKFKFEEKFNTEIDLREARNIVIENEFFLNLYMNNPMFHKIIDNFSFGHPTTIGNIIYLFADLCKLEEERMKEVLKLKYGELK